MDRDLYAVVFLTLCLSIFFVYLPNFSFLFPLEVFIAFIFLLIVAIVFNLERMLVSAFVLGAFAWLQGALPYISVVELQLAIFLLGASFIERDLYRIFTENVNNADRLLRSVLHGIGLFMAILALTLGFSFAVLLMGMQPDSANVYERLFGLPLYVLLIAILFAPISEEVLFRGFLAGRYGVLVSAILFSLSHVFYNSAFELAGAFLIGLALAYYFVRERNLVACIVAHSLYNFSSIALMLLAKNWAA